MLTSREADNREDVKFPFTSRVKEDGEMGALGE